MSDREQFEAARAAGLKARHETRVERAIRRQVAEEASAVLSLLLDNHLYVPVEHGMPRRACLCGWLVPDAPTSRRAAWKQHWIDQFDREIGAKETS